MNKYFRLADGNYKYMYLLKLKRNVRNHNKGRIGIWDCHKDKVYICVYSLV